MKNANLLLTGLLICMFCNMQILYAQDEPVIRFGLFADTQYGNCDSNGSRYYRNSLKKLADCVDSLNNREVQFTLNLGDIIDRNQEDLDSVMVCLGRLENKIYHITGNHDYKGVTENKILYEKLGMPSEYYFFKEKNWVFVFLNTNEVATYSNTKGTEKEQELIVLKENIRKTGGLQGANWNGGISRKQLEWLNALLDKCGKAGENVLVFSHHPLYPNTEFAALNNREILDVISNYSCVKALFAGHHHAGAFAYYNNIPVVTLEGMIETETENSFGIVTLYKDKIVVEGRGRMTSRVF